jgi:hypothetical protein
MRFGSGHYKLLIQKLSEKFLMADRKPEVAIFDENRSLLKSEWLILATMLQTRNVGR